MKKKRNKKKTNNKNHCGNFFNFFEHFKTGFFAIYSTAHGSVNRVIDMLFLQKIRPLRRRLFRKKKESTMTITVEKAPKEIEILHRNAYHDEPFILFVTIKIVCLISVKALINTKTANYIFIKKKLVHMLEQQMKFSIIILTKSIFLSRVNGKRIKSIKHQICLPLQVQNHRENMTTCIIADICHFMIIKNN